jgi:hypothetical protein
MHYQKSDDALKPYVDLVRSKPETKDRVLTFAKQRKDFLKNFCAYVKEVLSGNGTSLDDETIERIACITLSTYGFYF